MIRGRCAGIAFALLCAALPGEAGAALRLSTRTGDLDAARALAADALYADVAARLPPHWREALGDVAVEWRGGMNAQTVGRSWGTPGHGRIRLDPRLLDPAAPPSDADADADAATLARRTLVHELAHLYDRLPQGRLSRDPRLLDLAGWQRRPWRWAGRGANAMRDRSPDAYELHDPAEFVAVNLEDFVLDPQYRCRRPQLAAYFAARFGMPAPAADCAARLPMLSADDGRLELLEIDPERVAGIDYLFAEGNAVPMSHWGHAMLRLVICAPGRPRGPDCRLDLAYQRVLSFRAFVDDVQVSGWRGLTGRYPSRLYVPGLDEVVEDYTGTELRGLRSLPLRLDRDEIAGVLQRAAQLHWSYDGRYRFLSNNCAVETWKLLHDGVPRLAGLPLASVTPTGLLRRLVRTGVADAGVLDDPQAAVRAGYRFEPASARYQAMFDVLRTALPIPQRTLPRWLDAAPAERAGWVGQADLKAAAAMLLLEEAAQRREMLRARDLLKRRYGAGHGASRADAAGRMLDVENLAGRPAALAATGGYGLPQADERAAVQAVLRARAEAGMDGAEAWRRQLVALLPARERARLQAIEANLDAIGARLRRLGREADAPRLPGVDEDAPAAGLPAAS